MRKANALLTAALVIATASNAQEKQTVRFGIKASPNMCWIRSDIKEMKNDGNKVGFTFGLMAEFRLGGDNYAFATGALLNNTGGKVYFPLNPAVGGVDKLNSDIKLQYIELPATIKMYTNQIGLIRYWGQLGVNNGINVKAKADYDTFDATTGLVVNLEQEDIKDDIASYRSALLVGAGIEYNVSGNTNLLAGITYNNAFSNVYNNVEFGGKKVKGYSDYLELTLGVYF